MYWLPSTSTHWFDSASTPPSQIAFVIRPVRLQNGKAVAIFEGFWRIPESDGRCPRFQWAFHGGTFKPGPGVFAARRGMEPAIHRGSLARAGFLPRARFP